MAGINYSEERVYWYLRLNGFFPLTNFVVHKTPDITHRSDVDLIAIRMPYVFEEVGGRLDDFDSEILSLLGEDFDITALKKTIVVICEVKSSPRLDNGFGVGNYDATRSRLHGRFLL